MQHIRNAIIGEGKICVTPVNLRMSHVAHVCLDPRKRLGPTAAAFFVTALLQCFQLHRLACSEVSGGCFLFCFVLRAFASDISTVLLIVGSWLFGVSFAVIAATGQPQRDHQRPSPSCCIHDSQLNDYIDKRWARHADRLMLKDHRVTLGPSTHCYAEAA